MRGSLYSRIQDTGDFEFQCLLNKVGAATFPSLWLLRECGCWACGVCICQGLFQNPGSRGVKEIA